MTNPPSTRASLLVRIRDRGDSVAWGEFVDLYAPLLYRWAMRKGMQDADAADFVQEVLSAVQTGMPGFSYDPQRGSFRSWLFTVAHHELYDFRLRQRRHCQGSGDTEVHRLLDETPTPQEQSQWDDEYHGRLLALAAARVRPDFNETTWHAFWLTTLEEQTPQQVAAALGLSVGAVYIARSRVQARLRAAVQELEQDG